MFKIDCIVSDKNLAEVLHALSGRVMNLHTVPVANAETAPGGQVKPVAGSTVELLIKELRKRKEAALTPTIIREVVQKIGQSPKSWNYFIKLLKKAGAIKTNGQGSGVTYTLAKAKA